MKAKYIITALLIIMFFSCKKGHQHSHHDNHHGSANEFMHQSSVDNLIARFESPERDAYQKPEKVIEYLGNLTGLTIMDIGAGSGYFSFRLAKAGARVIAADVNDEFQNHIKKKIADFNLDSLGMELRKLPYDSPALKPAEVDKVLIVNTYHHIEDRVDYFKKVLEGIKPGGELVVIDYFKKQIPVGPPRGHKIARDVVLNELKSAGFKEFDINMELLDYQYIIRAK